MNNAREVHPADVMRTYPQALWVERRCSCPKHRRLLADDPMGWRENLYRCERCFGSVSAIEIEDGR